MKAAILKFLKTTFEITLTGQTLNGILVVEYRSTGYITADFEDEGKKGLL